MELDVEAVDLISAEKAPKGARMGMGIILGQLSVDLPVEALKELINYLKRIIKQFGFMPDIIMEINSKKIKIKSISQEQSDKLIDAYIDSVRKDN